MLEMIRITLRHFSQLRWLMLDYQEETAVAIFQRKRVSISSRELKKENKELPSAFTFALEKGRPSNDRRRAFEVDISAVPIQRIVQPVHHVLKRPESPSLSVHHAVFGKIERINHEKHITVTTAIDYIRKKMSSDEVPKSTFEHVYPKGTIVVKVSNHPHHVVRAAAISRYTLKKSYITFEDQPTGKESKISSRYVTATITNQFLSFLCAAK
jgi:hypothetical protein